MIILRDWNDNIVEVTVDNFKIGSAEDKFKITFDKVSDFDSVILWKPFILKFDREVERQMHNDQ